jgi:hypothetical protein
MSPAAWVRQCAAQLAALDEAGGPPGERLASLLAQLTRGPSLRAEDLAQRGADRKACRAAQRQVDAMRVKWVKRMLVGHGVKPSLAAHRARLVGDALLGETARVGCGGQPAGRLPFAELLRLVTALS